MAQKKSKMKPSVKRRWVKALRSGKYKQSDGQLCYTENDGSKSYCCLGVLCDIYNKDLWDGYDAFLGEESFLPDEVKKWAGLDERDPVLSERSTITDGTAANFNDAGRTFKQIATLIERNL